MLVLPFMYLLMKGYTLTPDAMIPFQQAIFPLLVLGFMIVAGFVPRDLRLTKETLDSHAFCGSLSGFYTKLSPTVRLDRRPLPFSWIIPVVASRYSFRHQRHGGYFLCSLSWTRSIYFSSLFWILEIPMYLRFRLVTESWTGFFKYIAISLGSE